MEEIWLDVIGYKGLYQVSNKGNVRSMDRYVYSARSKSGKRFVKGKVLTITKDVHGYHTVYFSSNGQGEHKKVHRLVCEVFHRKEPSKNQVNHIDGNKTNNSPENLEWCTSKANTHHAIENGLWLNIGENAKDNILKEHQVLEIRNNHVDSYDKLAELYGVAKSTIVDIKHFKSWKWLGGDQLIDTSAIDKIKFCQAIKHIRNQHALTQKEFALSLGVTRSTVIRWEKGEIFPKDGMLRKLSEIYGLKF